MPKFVKTGSILDRILDRKVQEVAEAQAQLPLADLRQQAETASPAHDFVGALQRETVALIAEVKKASPSKGVMVADFDPVRIATTYAENGAAAISVLTDQDFFQGHLDYLQAINQTVTIPTLRKDFIIAPYQIYQARAAGASAVLLIVAALDDAQLRDLYALITELGMAALVEVHDEAELARALTVQPRLIGVNNRDLRTFDVDLNTTKRIAELVPSDVTLVAESGMKTAKDVARMGAMGAQAVLIGEGLVTADDMAQAVQQFSSQARG
ncbi:MAG: indole-3-glycerol phosphate synthase TrpC [Anaerolineae bacterium]